MLAVALPTLSFCFGFSHTFSYCMKGLEFYRKSRLGTHNAVHQVVERTRKSCRGLFA